MFKSRTITISLRFYGSFAAGRPARAPTWSASPASTTPIIDQVIGPLDLGWKGGVGNHLAYTLLVGVALRHRSGRHAAHRVPRRRRHRAGRGRPRLEVVPLTRAPMGANFWPVITAFSVGHRAARAWPSPAAGWR